ncbi:LysR family transcriptional regulator [Peribacillus cavernae]|uniref:LysR family transcriptional regulator n=1 Tax=Peribacillus cavernae TaxID=1674310 RepID=A0A3S0VMC5_9BACI|nr:LysR family transcriptional regulator [Peribacillus cavernae]MDQ0218668.1 DNA-binding transcriptional LysR family regulator [Peribacillus cavernae]RUQ30889.1 LysR family transcriptional regulator [Peribacillus cavernae]
MDIKQLHYFCTIVEEGQITRAAKKLLMAQPPLSQQLKQLEEELGVILFERTGKRMELTVQGKILYKRAISLLNQVSETIVEVKESGEGISGTVSIGTVQTCFSYLPQKLLEFRKIYPHVTFQLRSGDTYRVSQLVKNRETEIGIVRFPLEMEGFSEIRLPIEPYVALYPRAWGTESGLPTSIKMKELTDVPLLLLHRVNGIGQFELIVNECKRHGFNPKVICECPDASILLTLVASGIGVTIVPKSTILLHHLDTISIVELEDSSIQSESSLIWLKERYISKGARHLIEMFLDDRHYNAN